MNIGIEKNMTTWFVTRHPGAIAWMKKQPVAVDRWVSHLDADEIREGDTVIGILPLHAAAKVCEKGAIFLALSIELTEEQRGRELSLQDLENISCSLRRFDVRAL